MLDYPRLKRLASNKHSSLFGPLIRNKEKTFVNTAPGTVITTCHFLLNCTNGPNKLVLFKTRLEMLASVKHSSLAYSYVAKKKVLGIQPLGP